jgi:hypothetical protein
MHSFGIFKGGLVSGNYVSGGVTSDINNLNTKTSQAVYV